MPRLKNSITPFGWKVKMRLAELQLTQKEFCKLHNIPENRLSDLMVGTRLALKEREKVSQILNISEENITSMK